MRAPWRSPARPSSPRRTSGPTHQEQREAARAQAFAQADADGNGALSPQEFETFKTLMSQLHKRDWFARADANGDGQVTMDELRGAPTWASTDATRAPAPDPRWIRRRAGG